jgi:ribonuclease P protein component
MIGFHFLYLYGMNNKYPKAEKLKSKTIIDSLFSKGKSVSNYPLRLVCVPLDVSTTTPILMGVSVSKKYFKKAVDRNYFKRVLRETYRLNKKILLEKTENQPYAFMFFYQTKEKLSYQEIEQKTIQLFQKFNPLK